MRENADQNNSEYRHFLRSHKCTNFGKMKVACSSEIFKTIYHNGNYLLLFEKRKLQSF